MNEHEVILHKALEYINHLGLFDSFIVWARWAYPVNPNAHKIYLKEEDNNGARDDCQSDARTL
jgi:hypothetical protein